MTHRITMDISTQVSLKRCAYIWRLYDVDSSTVINAHIIESPVFDAITPKELSGGVKVLILMLKDDSFVYNMSNCETTVRNGF